MLRTPLTELLDTTFPIQLAGMPGIATPALVRAVAEAGGIGMLPGTSAPPDMLAGMLDALPKDAPGAIGVNFLMPFLDPAAVEVAARKVRLVEFFYGDPDPELIRNVHAQDALVCWQVGSVGEAVAAERAGCDVIGAQGTEAGGHVRGRTSLLPLLSAVLEAVTVPVIAAGGLATARDVAAVLATGAAGARVGTRFVAATESGAHPQYRDAVLAASGNDTVLTEAFSVMWPDAPHRVLRSAAEAAAATVDDIVGETTLGGQKVPVERFSVLCPSTATTGHIKAMALYAGESATNVVRMEPAADIVRELATGAERLLDRARSGGRR